MSTHETDYQPEEWLMDVTIDQIDSHATKEALGEYQRLVYRKRMIEADWDVLRSVVIKMRDEGDTDSEIYRQKSTELSTCVKNVETIQQELYALEEREPLRSLCKELMNRERKKEIERIQMQRRSRDIAAGGSTVNLRTSSDGVHKSERDTRAMRLSNGYLLLHAIDANIYTSEERALVREYRQKHHELVTYESEARALRAKSIGSKLGFFENIKYKRLAEKIRVCKNYLMLDESDPHLRGLIERERARAIREMDEQHRKATEERTPKQIQEEQERSRQKAAEREKAARTREIRKELLSALNTTDDTLSPTGKLAVVTVMSVMKDQWQHKDSLVCKTNLAICDTIIYTSFLVRALALGDVSNAVVAEQFTNEFFSYIITATSRLFPVENVSFEEIFNNRIMFYDRVFMKKQGTSDPAKAIMEEFEIVLKTDALHNSYVEFSENSPLPILGIDVDMQCSLNVAEYHAELFGTIKYDLPVVQRQLQQQ